MKTITGKLHTANNSGFGCCACKCHGIEGQQYVHVNVNGNPNNFCLPCWEVQAAKLATHPGYNAVLES